MPARIREEIRREIARERAAGCVAIEVSAIRSHLVEAELHLRVGDGRIIDLLIIEECANAAIPVILEPYDPTDQINVET